MQGDEGLGIAQAPGTLEDKLQKVNRKELAQDCFNFISTRAYLDLNGWSEIDIFRH